MGSVAKNRSQVSTVKSKLGSKWYLMIGRCTDPCVKGYKRYGGRGITVCDEWMGSKEAFIEWGLANGYKVGLELDRADNDGPYAPWNCRFVTHQENARNRSSNFHVTAFGETKLMTEWSEDSRCVVDIDLLWQRLRRDKMEPERAITSSPNVGNNRDIMLAGFGETKRLAEWANDPRCPVQYTNLVIRVCKRGMTIEEAFAVPSPAWAVARRGKPRGKAE